MINGLYIAFLLIMIWVVAILYLAPYISKSKHFGLLGPALMIKSVKNRGVIDAIAKRFPGKAFGKISVVIVIISAVLGLALLVYGAILSVNIKPSNAPSLSLILGIPGLNPAIPISFGLATIIVSVAIHEIFHGVVAKNHGIKLSSVGALFFVIPLGAFVEPDEAEISQSDPIVRRRVIAAGPGINIVLAVIALLIIAFVLMPAASPQHAGLYVESVASGSPGSYFIKPGTELISIGNSTATYSGDQLTNITQNSILVPGQNYTAVIDKAGRLSSSEVTAGIVVDSLIAGYPADSAGITAGSLIISINNLTIYNETSMISILHGTPPNTAIKVTVENFASTGSGLVGHISTYNVTTTSVYDYYSAYDPSANSAAFKNQSFIGVTTSYLGLSAIPISDMQSLLSGREIFSNPWNGMLAFISLPFYSFSPVPSSLAVLFNVPFNPLIYWGLVNVLYWLFWWDFLLGITNALPASILDGGQFFKDSLTILGRRESLRFLRDEKNLKRLTTMMGVIVLLLFMWEIIVPRII